ncbi:MAG: GAF domain-containing protein [Candidatus Tectomicrobia bacterium]|nr:GAF domain-containing protein [Candidatus Tectomicrobia bacterium]
MSRPTASSSLDARARSRAEGDAGDIHAPEVQVAADTIVHAALELEEVSAAFLYLLSEDGRGLELRGATSKGASALEGPSPFLPLDESPGWRPGGREQPVTVSEPGQDVLWSRLFPDVEGDKRVFATVPLSATEGLLGVLLCVLSGDAPVSSASLSFLKALAPTSAALVESSQRLAQARLLRPIPQIQVRNALGIEKISRKILAGLDAEKALSLIVRSAAGALPGCFVHIHLLDDSKKTLRLAAAQTLRKDPAGPKELTLPIDRSPAGWVVAKRQALVLSAEDEEERWTPDDWQRRVGIAWYAGFPLLGDGRVLGVLSCLGGPETSLGEGERDLLQGYAEQASLVLLHTGLRQEVQTYKARLLQSERHRTLNAMMRGVAHDFNNLLGVILTRAQLLMLRTEQPETLKELESIERASYQGAMTIRRMLEFTKNSQETEFAPLDLAAMVQEVVTLTKGRWHEKPAKRDVRIDLRCEIPDDLPPVQIDAVEIREVLAELIYNAVDAMPRGGSLFISAQVEGEMVALRFTDTGIGIDEAARARIFEPYFTTKGGEGTGLGLSNALSIIQRNGGRIDVKSVPGQGTTVSIYLHLEPSLLQKELPFQAKSPTRILVAGGKAEVRDLLERVLRMDGHEVVATGGGRAALGLLQREPGGFDLVMMDQRMKRQPVFRQVQASFPGTPVVFFSGWGLSSEEEDAALPRDSNLALSQPFSLARVIETVRETLQLHGP